MCNGSFNGYTPTNHWELILDIFLCDTKSRGYNEMNNLPCINGILFI